MHQSEFESEFESDLSGNDHLFLHLVIISPTSVARVYAATFKLVTRVYAVTVRYLGPVYPLVSSIRRRRRRRHVLSSHFLSRS